MTKTERTEYFPSIFNDVIGPVMRGPSSSHCTASLRIGRICRDLMDEEISRVLIEFDPAGSLATTHSTHGSDMGLFGGFLGWQASDERLVHAERHLKDAGIDVQIRIRDIKAGHPNTYRLTVANDEETHVITALSTGGGMIRIIGIDGFDVSLEGDYAETLIFTDTNADEILGLLKDQMTADHILHHVHDGSALIEIKAQEFPPGALLERLEKQYSGITIKRIHPVLPVFSRRNISVPFADCRGMLAWNESRGLPLWELALEYESSRGNISGARVLEMMQEITAVIRSSIADGMAGTEYSDRILLSQTPLFRKKLESGDLLDAGILNRAVMYVSALMEMKSSMGVIVAAPTAGACGGLPGTVTAAAEAMELTEEDTAKALLAAGLIGVFIASGATFAAEVGGCQAECGAGSGMAAAALVTLTGGSTMQAVNAASMALQNIFGMTCDPVADRVEVPCLGKNILAAGNALTSANLALAGYDAVIPLDQVITAMHETGKSLPRELRCTGLGGLSLTPASRKLAEKLNRRRGQ